MDRLDELFKAIPAGTWEAHTIEHLAQSARVPEPDRGMAHQPPVMNELFVRVHHLI